MAQAKAIRIFFGREPVVVIRRCRILLLFKQLLQRRLLGGRFLQHQRDVAELESRFDRPQIEPRLRHGMEVASEDYRPEGVNRRRDAVWLRQESAR